VINIKDKLVTGPPKLPAEAFRLMLPKLNIVVDEQEYVEPEIAEEKKEEVAEGKEEKEGEEEGNEEGKGGEDGEDDEEEKSAVDSDSDSEDEQLPVVTNESTMKITRMLNSKMTPAIIRQRGMDDLWIFRAMRSILNSKMVEDSMLFSGSYTLQSGLGCRRTR
jgi:hypothetical protein